MRIRIAALAILAAALAAPFVGDVPAQTRPAIDAPAPSKPVAVTPPDTDRPNIDLVLCLDTSNSMDGLIQSAKIQLWDIVNTLATATPTPELRVAVYSYGNNGYSAEAGWVRQDLGFTGDLDKVNEVLYQLTTNGGTEYVGRVVSAAMSELDWNRDASTLRVVYVAGNESAFQDREHPAEEVAGRAIASDIVVNTIFCGNDGDRTADSWRAVARRGEGRYFAIEQDAAIAVATPYDAELEQLSSSLNSTYMFYGSRANAFAENQSAQDSNARSLGSGVAAARAESKASALYKNDADLVDYMASGKSVAALPASELPEELRSKSAPEREAAVKKLADDRAAIQKKIKELGEKRRAHIEAEAKKASGTKTLNTAVTETLKEQAKKKGFEIGRK